ncbi:hypothetical protein HRI_004814300 [Hibiscus trionum]|uniref:Uncharacterized protein n=1 Tax=Hibiscus trionum TaxID=183268 RepID=A0A9W7J9X6_HIBTR|nr:hypothetical protein HRI_004814300 [Hibiscus trionum]
MATTAAVARNLLKNSKSLPQILRGQILGRSNATANLNNIAKDHHQIVQSLFVSNQKIHAQIPIFDFTEIGSLVGSNGGLSLAEKGVVVEDDGDESKDDFEDEIDDGDDEFDDGEDDDDDDDGAFDDDTNKIKF